MRTTSTHLTAGAAASAEPARQQSAGSIENRRARWRLALESAWQRKVDEVIALTKAYPGPASDDDGSRASQGTQVSRLRARTDRAYEDLAAIETAMSRVEDGTYGTCAGCNGVISDEWLGAKPEVRHCQDCS